MARRHKLSAEDPTAFDATATCALLEALANYQQHLIEEFQSTVTMLPRLGRHLGKTGADPKVKEQQISGTHSDRSPT